MKRELIFSGVVSRVEKGMVSVLFPDERVSALIPLIQYASAYMKISSKISPNDPVAVLTPDGNPDNGLAVRGTFTDEVADPGDGDGVKIEMADGTTFVISDSGIEVKHSSGVEATMSGGKMSIKGDLEVDGDITSTGEVEDSAGKMSRLRTNYNTAQYMGNLGSLTSTTNKVDQ